MSNFLPTSLRRLMPAVLSVAFAGAALSKGEAADFFKPGPTAPDTLAPEMVYPRGREFLFSFYSLGGGERGKNGAPTALLSEEQLNAEMRQYKEAGFSIFGPQYELTQRSLEDAQKHDMGVVYSIGLPLKFTREKVEIEPEEVASELTRQIKAVAENRRIAAWDLKPEELRPWRKNEMEYLKAAARAVREADPLKRPIYHYMPGHASAKRMMAIAPWVDLLGKGMYTNYSSMQESRIWCRWTIEEELAAIEATNSTAVPLAVSEMFQQPSEEDLPKIPTWVRHDLYLSLVSGAKGIVVFSLRPREGFDAFEAYYRAYAQVGKELLGDERLADVFLFGEKRGDLTLKVIQGPETVEMVYPAGGVKEPKVYPSIAHLNTAYGASRYLFLVNSANEAVSLEVGDTPESGKVQALFGPAVAPEVSGGKMKIKLQPLEVAAYRFDRL